MTASEGRPLDQRAAAERAAIDRETLVSIGLRPREPVRFRRLGSERWHHGTMRSVSADGSLTINDDRGAARNLRPDAVEVQRPGARGRLTWQAVADVAVTWEQLGLFDPRHPSPS